MEDHRKLGRELGLFGTDPLIGAGLPFWLPAGAVVRHALEEYLRELEQQAGYQHVYSPVLGKRDLYELSGHWSHYRDGMYPPVELGGEHVVIRRAELSGARYRLSLPGPDGSRHRPVMVHRRPRRRAPRRPVGCGGLSGPGAYDVTASAWPMICCRAAAWPLKARRPAGLSFR